MVFVYISKFSDYSSRPETKPKTQTQTKKTKTITRITSLHSFGKLSVLKAQIENRRLNPATKVKPVN